MVKEGAVPPRPNGNCFLNSFYLIFSEHGYNLKKMIAKYSGYLGTSFMAFPGMAPVPATSLDYHPARFILGVDPNYSIFRLMPLIDERANFQEFVTRIIPAELMPYPVPAPSDLLVLAPVGFDFILGPDTALVGMSHLVMGSCLAVVGFGGIYLMFSGYISAHIFNYLHNGTTFIRDLQTFFIGPSGIFGGVLEGDPNLIEYNYAARYQNYYATEIVNMFGLGGDGDLLLGMLNTYDDALTSARGAVSELINLGLTQPTVFRREVPGDLVELLIINIRNLGGIRDIFSFILEQNPLTRLILEHSRVDIGTLEN